MRIVYRITLIQNRYDLTFNGSNIIKNRYKYIGHFIKNTKQKDYLVWNISFSTYNVS